MAHTPDWHLLDNNFSGSNDGLALPFRNQGSLSPAARNTRFATGATHQIAADGVFGLRITNLDAADPPGYHENDVPRRSTFNRNVFSLTEDPRMPKLHVECEVSGFDPTEFPIQWRLQCRHVLCRHTNHGHYRYGGACEIFNLEW